MSRMDGASITTARDFMEVLPAEIWNQCIVEATQGDRRMGELLNYTLVSKRWNTSLINTPTLWSHIHVNDAEEDAAATIATFLHLSRESPLSLGIRVPLSVDWEIAAAMLSQRSHQIRDVMLQIDLKFDLSARSPEDILNSASLQETTHTIIRALGLSTSLENLHIVFDNALQRQSSWRRYDLVLIGRWPFPLKPLDLSSSVYPCLRELSVEATEMINLAPQLSTLQHLESLLIYSSGQDHFTQPSDEIMHESSLDFPSLFHLRYHGTWTKASSQLITAASFTLQCLDLSIKIADFKHFLFALGTTTALRKLILTLLVIDIIDIERDNPHTEDNPKWNSAGRTITLAIPIPSWRLNGLRELKCDVRHGGTTQIFNLRDFSVCFLTIFPNLRVFVSNLPVHYAPTWTFLVQQTQLKHFELTSEQNPFDTLPISMSKSRVAWPRAVAHHRTNIDNLLHVSLTLRSEFYIPEPIEFTQLHSLDLVVPYTVIKIVEINSRLCPVLRRFSISILGSQSAFDIRTLSSLTDITISTRLPTFTQAMEFCAHLYWDPAMCPSLQQLSMDSFVEWDLLYLLLVQRNFLQPAVSRIKRLTIPHILPEFGSIAPSLLAGRLEFLSPLEGLEQFSYQLYQSRLLDRNTKGCFCCIYIGILDCTEPVRDPVWPGDPSLQHEGSWVTFAVMEEMGISPTFNWNISNLQDSQLNDSFGGWWRGRKERRDKWMKAAYQSSKQYHRALMCQKQLNSPRVLITERGVFEIKAKEVKNLATNCGARTPHRCWPLWFSNNAPKPDLQVPPFDLYPPFIYSSEDEVGVIAGSAGCYSSFFTVKSVFNEELVYQVYTG